MRSLAVLIILLAVTFNSVHARGKVISTDDGVKIYQRMSIIPHGTDSYSIEVNGKIYDDLSSGFYVRIPEKNLICFSTESALGPTYLHIVSLTSAGDAFQIKLSKEISGFTSNLGLKKTDVGSTYVEALSGDFIYFAEKISSGVIGHYRLDLRTHTIKKIDSALVPKK